jgi:hypothetical protein
MFRRHISLLLLTGLCCISCGGSARTPADAAAQASQRLQGDWRLLSFQPSLALEEPIKGLLDAQIKSLTVTFSNGELTAAGPGVNTSGHYQIDSAEGDSLNGHVYDRAGAGYGVSGQFVGSQFRFMSQDSPWSGQGVLERVR